MTRPQLTTAMVFLICQQLDISVVSFGGYIFSSETCRHLHFCSSLSEPSCCAEISFQPSSERALRIFYIHQPHEYPTMRAYRWILPQVRSSLRTPSRKVPVNPILTFSRRRLYSAAAQPSAQPEVPTTAPTNPPLSFPCLDALESRTAQLQSLRSSSQSGPEPSYTTGAHQRFHSSSPLHLEYGGILSSYDLAYETWGKLNTDKSNAIILFTGLSASSHAKSNELNKANGWWENFIGPGRPLDTDKFFIVCANVLGGCYGSTGPSSIDPSDGKPYATRFPIVTLGDMVNSQFRLLDSLGIEAVYASVGASMGGMLSLASAKMYPKRVKKLVSISACARSHPYSIALRHTQRQGGQLYF